MNSLPSEALNDLFRRLFKDTVIYGIGDLILKATAFITIPIYTRIFSPTEYGVWSYIVATIGLLSPIVMLGLDQAYALYFFEYRNLNEKQVLTSTMLLFVAGWCCIVVMLCFPFLKNFSLWSFETEDHRWICLLALLTMPLTMITMLCAQALRNQFKARLFIGLNLCTTLLSVALSLLAVCGLDAGIAGILWGPFIAMVILLPWRLWAIRNLLGLHFSFRLLRDMLSYGFPLVPAFIAIWVYSSADRLIMGKILSLEEVGLFSVATSLSAPMVVGGTAFGQAWSPHAVLSYKKDAENASFLFGQVFTCLLVFFGILAVGLTVFAREALAILTSSKYYSAAGVIGPIAFASLAKITTQITLLGIHLNKKTGFISLYTWILAGISLGLNLLLIPHWGMLAAGWVSAFCSTAITLAYGFTSQRFWPVFYEKKKVAIISILTTFFILVASWLPGHLSAGLLVVKMVYAGGYMFTLIGFRIITLHNIKTIIKVIRA